MTDAPSPEQIRDWLRASATLVKPGETLIVSAPPHSTPNHVRDLQAYLSAVADFPVLVVPPGAFTEAVPAAARTLDEQRAALGLEPFGAPIGAHIWPSRADAP